MHKNSILLSQLSPDQLKELVGSSVQNQLSEFSKSFKTLQTSDELLTREETAEFLKIDLSTLWHWTNKGRIKAYSISSRRYYKKTEILEALKPLKK